ncbi:MAG: hypothetical protein GHCLOJNM_03020 [bacterium]|nr:hypothetical protein [bacterium]
MVHLQLRPLTPIPSISMPFPRLSARKRATSMPIPPAIHKRKINRNYLIPFQPIL